MGLKSETLAGRETLGTGQTVAFFKIVGKLDSSTERLKRKVTAGERLKEVNLKTNTVIRQGHNFSA